MAHALKEIVDLGLGMESWRFRGVAKQIVRCAATNVNPATAERDMRLPQLLDEAFGANLCGVYLDVIEGGRIAPGDTLQLID